MRKKPALARGCLESILSGFVLATFGAIAVSRNARGISIVAGILFTPLSDRTLLIIAWCSILLLLIRRIFPSSSLRRLMLGASTAGLILAWFFLLTRVSRTDIAIFLITSIPFWVMLAMRWRYEMAALRNEREAAKRDHEF